MGKIYFCEAPKFYHVRYVNNSSDDGNIRRGRLRRLIWFLSGKNPYMNPVKDLLNGYLHILDYDVVCFLDIVDKYQCSFCKKIKLLFDFDFRRPSRFSTLLLKLAVLFNRF